MQEAIRSTLALVNKNLPVITYDEWSTLSQLCQILRPFGEVTSMMSAQNYLTGSYVIVMTRCLIESCNKIWAKPDLSSLVSDVALLLKSGLTERFKNIELSGTLLIASFMDPRFKIQAFSDRNEAVRTVVLNLGVIAPQG